MATSATTENVDTALIDAATRTKYANAIRIGGVNSRRTSPATLRARAERSGATGTASSSTRWRERISATATPASPTATTAIRQPNAAVRPPTTMGASTQPRL